MAWQAARTYRTGDGPWAVWGTANQALASDKLGPDKLVKLGQGRRPSRGTIHTESVWTIAFFWAVLDR